jgi:hypothetical protein
MCDCTSCSYTDAYSGRADLFSDGSPTIKGFDNWPRGKSKGFSASKAEYAAHAKHCGSSGMPKPWRFVAGKPAQFSTYGLVMPVQPAPKWLHDWINRKAPDQAEARPASPETPAKAPQHFPGLDRQPETATIYAMPKAKEQKQPRGRPALPGRRVVIKLTEEQIKRAEKRGGGNVAAGIRKALGG